jgi:transcriptional regulator of acetoin/glycerol metabolism
MLKPSIVNPRLARIAQARRSMLQDRDELPTGAIAPWVERSWQRCLDYGLESHATPVFQQLSQTQMRQALEASQQLAQTAKPILESLGRAIVNTRYFAILTNREGIVVDVSGAIDHSDPRAHLISRIGTDLSERSIGTTAIGMALTDLQPVWLHRGEHYFSDTAVYSCAGAPLFGPDGACVGMLDLTGIEVLERPELKHLVTQCAGKIENALVLAQAHRLILRLNWPGNALGGDADGMVCLDADGWVTGANQIARQMVPALITAGQASVHASEMFGIAHELLFDAARHAGTALEIPLWTGLRLQALPIDRSDQAQPLRSSPRAPAGNGLPLKEIETALIRRAVEQARGNVAEAARALGIGRATVYRKLGQFPINR